MPGRDWRATGPIALALLLAAGSADAGDSAGKGLFDRDEVETFVLRVEWPGYFVDLYGIAERAGGGFWITGVLTKPDSGTSEGYLAAIDGNGLVLDEYSLAIGNADVTEFWWPQPLGDGRLAVAFSLDPLQDTADAGVAIIGQDGAVERDLLMSEMGVAGAEIVHVSAMANGDLTIVGATREAASSAPRQALVVRLDRTLKARWVATEVAPDPELDLMGYASVVLADDSVVVGGAATDEDFADGIGWLARFDPDGILDWRRWPETEAAGEARTAVNWVTARPGIIVHLQSAYDPDGAPLTSVLSETAPDGTSGPEHMVDLPEGVELITLASAENGDMLIGGFDTESQAPLVGRVAPDGALLWNVAFPELPWGTVWAIVETEDGAVVAVGTYDDGERIGGFVVSLSGDGERG